MNRLPEPNLRVIRQVGRTVNREVMRSYYRSRQERTKTAPKPKASIR